eukprot:m.77927 g.77927  ORF g.77927 m.77927 type:complete len:83 (-) comp8556_c9_seq1:433-681(-)
MVCVCVCVIVCVCVCDDIVCVCVCDRERERELFYKQNNLYTQFHSNVHKTEINNTMTPLSTACRPPFFYLVHQIFPFSLPHQ